MFLSLLSTEKSKCSIIKALRCDAGKFPTMADLTKLSSRTEKGTKGQVHSIKDALAVVEQSEKNANVPTYLGGKQNTG
jgi:hypothetical protein